MGEQHPPTGDADLAAVGWLLAEPARSRVLLALVDGRALPATMLAAEAGVAPSTASYHLAKLADAGLITVCEQGRHRYFALAGPHVAELLEAVARVAPTRPITSLRQGTRAHAMRYARRCYDHLAGRLGVAVADALCRDEVLTSHGNPDGYTVTAHGADILQALGVRAEPGESVRGCLDWTEQREHLAGTLGRALLSGLLNLGWLDPDAHTRAMRLTAAGRKDLPRRLGIQLP